MKVLRILIPLLVAIAIATTVTVLVLRPKNKGVKIGIINDIHLEMFYDATVGPSGDCRGPNPL